MAKLIKCGDCRKKISARAESCPNCGAPVDASAKTSREYSLSGFLSALLIAACIVVGIGAHEKHLIFSIFSFVVAIILIKPVRFLVASKLPKPKIAAPLIYVVFASLWAFWLSSIDISDSATVTTTTVHQQTVPDPAPAIAPTKEVVQSAQPVDMWVSSDRLARHTCPKSSCGVVGSYFFREKATVLEERGTWARVSKYYNASCLNGVSEYVDSGNTNCDAANGIENQQFAEWVELANLVSKRPPDPAAGATGAYELVSMSDDYKTYKDVFAKAATELIASKRCTAAEFKENGGWVKSMEQKNQPIYFMYCGGYNKVYLDAAAGKVTN